jgi:Ulp1 family protease
LTYLFLMPPSIFTCQVPRQHNDYDCGLFMLYYIDRFILEAPERLTKEGLGMVQIALLHYFCSLIVLIPNY